MRARVVQWWEQLLPTNVAWVQTPASMPYAGWVCRWFSPCFKKFFLQVLWFSLLLQNQYFQIPIWPGMVDEEPLCGFSISRSSFISLFLLIFSIYFPLSTIHFACPHLPLPYLKFCIYDHCFQSPLGIMVIPREIEVACAKFWWLMSCIMGNGKWWM